MDITVVAMMCHMLANISSPVCHEAIVVKQEMTMNECAMSQPAIAEWKEHSIYKGDQWRVVGFKCAPGDYTLKDDI